MEACGSQADLLAKGLDPQHLVGLISADKDDDRPDAFAYRDEDTVGHEHFVGPEKNKEFMKIKLLSREQISETLILRRLELSFSGNLDVTRQNSGPFE